MSGSMACFTLNDACVKLAAQSIPLFQTVFLRGIVTTVLMLLVVRAMGRLDFSIPRADRPRVFWRTASELGAMVAFTIALVNMPIANISAILAALPLTVTLAAFLFLREPVGWRRMLAILVGFVGVILIIQPGTEGFSYYSLVAFLAVILVTVRDLVTRRFSKEVPSMSVAVITAAAVGILAGLLSTRETWAMPDTQSILLILGAAVFIIGGYVFSIMTMRIGEIGVIAPFRYTSLIWALMLGYVVFGDWPNSLTLLGGAIVVATGLFTILRERRVARRLARNPASPTATAAVSALTAGARDPNGG
mgnify:CR=1 FL=1